MLLLRTGDKGHMGVVQIQLPDELKSIIDRHVAEGRAASEAAYVAEALRLYAELLDSDDEIAEIIERADADIAAERYVTVRTQVDSEALHEAAMDRLRAQLAIDASS
jgi:Arc/MetJ-type ribon-helix-helix transcriptional regulator